MKVIKVQALEMVRRIRDRHAKALVGKSAAEIIHFYRAAGLAAKQGAVPSARSRRTPANRALQPMSRAPRKVKAQRTSRAARG
jgi:hypothetical protein